jgi:hypothetical protein
MCISESVSWSTLAIGTIANILILIYLSRIQNPKVIIPIILVLAWQYALLMQIPDALAWRDPHADYPGKLAFILNTTQPLIYFILIVIALSKMGISLLRLAPAVVAIAVYSILTIKETLDRKSYNINPPENCKHLSYPWWDTPRYLLYMAAIVLTTLALAPEWGYIILSLALFIGSTLAANVVAGDCPSGSLWCWSIAGSGVVTFIYYILSQRK